MKFLMFTMQRGCWGRSCRVAAASPSLWRCANSFWIYTSFDMRAARHFVPGEVGVKGLIFAAPDETQGSAAHAL